MSRVVYRYAFPEHSSIEGGAILRVPFGRVVLVAAQDRYDRLPTVWIEHNDGELRVADRMELKLVGTGQVVIDGSMKHLGSCVCANGVLIWHIYGPKITH